MGVQEAPQRPSNYEIMRNRMEAEFVKYDQDTMIRRFGLKNDADYLFIRFVGRDYRINRMSGRVEWFSGKRKTYLHADYNESMTIFDMLTYSREGCRLDGRFVLPDDFKGMVKSASSNSDLFTKQAAFFAGKGEALKKACLKLGGKPGITGDVSSTIPLFDFFPVVVQFWDADEEFEAVLKFMWDKNAVDFMHFETIAFATAHLIARLKEELQEVFQWEK